MNLQTPLHLFFHWPKKIPGYPGFRVMKSGKIISPRDSILSPQITKGGYLRAGTSVQGKPIHISVHRAIALAFIPNPNNFPQVNHLNGIKTDNRIENLEWCTGLYNMQHAYEQNLVPIIKGERHGQSRLTIAQVKDIRRKYRPYKYTLIKLAREYGVGETTIWHAIHDKWSHVA